MYVNASFPSFSFTLLSSLSLSLSLSVYLTAVARSSPSTKALIRPSQPFPSGGLRAEESPSEWVFFIWSGASGRRGLIFKKGPSVDLLSSNRERQTWWISELLREAGTGRPESANKKNCRPPSLPPALVHSFLPSLRAIPSLALICSLFCPVLAACCPPPLPPAELTCIFIIWACTTLTCVFFYLLILHKPLARLSFSFQLCRGMPHAGFHTKAAEGVSGSSLIQQRGNIFHSGGFKHAVAVVKTWAI